MFTRSMRGLAAALVMSAGSVLPGAATAQDASGPDSLTEAYKDWSVICRKADGAERRSCEMTQQLRRNEGGQRVFRIAVQPGTEDGGSTIVMVAPFGLLLSEGVRLSIGETALASGGFTTCLPMGCIARAEVDAAAIARMKAGEEMTARMQTTTGQAVALSLSLSGFTAAWERLNAL